MLESTYTLGAISAGACCVVAIMALADRSEGIDATTWLNRRRHAEAPPATDSQGAWSTALAKTGMRPRLLEVIDRAGWNEGPERLSAFAAGFAACMAVIAAATASIAPVANPLLFGAIGLGGGLALCLVVLRAAIATRRRRLAAELVPLLELFTLELSGGGSAASALGSVSTKLQGELASDLRRLLIASQVVGSIPFELRLMRYSEHLDIPAIGSLATILAASREYGTGALQGVRALATDLRHAQRRQLIAHSRRALNHVLLPAGVGVLLPFLAVVMFPAVTALQRNLH